MQNDVLNAEPTVINRRGSHLEPYRFKRGQSGNPKGRKKGSLNKLTELALNALSIDFEEHGLATIERLREEDPGRYLDVVAKLIGPKLRLEEEPFKRLPVVTIDMTGCERIEGQIGSADRRGYEAIDYESYRPAMQGGDTLD